jgi:hypothetical protein
MTVSDYFNFTVAKTQQESYNLSGTLGEWASGPINNITIPACNATGYTDDWSLDVWTAPWWNTERWNDFTLPELAVQFDGKTANLSLNGDFVAYPYVRSSASDWFG